MNVYSPNVVQTSSLDVLEVIFGYPCVPMLFQRTGCPVAVQHLTKRILVNNIGVVGVLENAGGYPGLLAAARQTAVNTRDAAL